MRIATLYRRSVLGLSLAALLATAPTPAWAVNDVFDSSCPAPCLKPPKENLFLRGYGDLDPNGATPTITGVLAKGTKKTVVQVDVTFMWFALGSGFRPFTVRINNKYPGPNFVVLNWIDSCSSGLCTRSMQYQFDMDAQEAIYPGEFIGQPLLITFDSARTADANSSYQIAMSAQVFKKK